MARLRVAVVRALPEEQSVVALELEEGARVEDALRASGLGEAAALGIGGRRVDRGRRLRDGDRVEILRPLAEDPKDARRRRAARRPPRRA